MHDTVTMIWGITILIALLGSIPYGIWIIHTVIKKRWRRVGLQLGIPLVWFLLLACASAIVDASVYKQYLTNLYDTEVVLGEPVFQYRSDRSFHGDGYSISVYELPTSVRDRFESFDERLRSEFPKHPSYRDHWNFERWREAPFDERFDEYLDFALSSYDSDQASGLSDQFEAIRSALSQKGTYYAFFYSHPGNHPGNIDLFIVDLKGERLYSMNHNT